MCVTCGCSDGAETTITHLSTVHSQTEGAIDHTHTHVMADGTVVTHSHGSHSHDSHSHRHSHQHPHQYPHSADDQQFHSQHSHFNHPHLAHQPEPASAATVHAQLHGTTLTLEQNLLSKNNLIAAQNRGWLKGRQTLALNLVSSPGSGKTTLLTRTIADLKSEFPFYVIEGDQATSNDALRIQATGCEVVQVNTGTGCHLEAEMIERSLQQLNPVMNSVVMIENVGNLVCPALFDLGETAKVVILSTTEGEDKPIKYPHMFRASQVMILTKVDLLPYLQFDVDRCIAYARQVNPDMQIFQVSATTGAGLEHWYDWLRQRRSNGCMA